MLQPSLRMGLSLMGGWDKATRIIGKTPFYLLAAQRKAIMDEALMFKDEIQRGIRDQAPGGKTFRPLSPYTLAIRQFLRFKSEKALIQHQDLLRSIKVERVG